MCETISGATTGVGAVSETVVRFCAGSPARLVAVQVSSSEAPDPAVYVTVVVLAPEVAVPPEMTHV